MRTVPLRAPIAARRRSTLAPSGRGMSAADMGGAEGTVTLVAAGGGAWGIGRLALAGAAAMRGGLLATAAVGAAAAGAGAAEGAWSGSRSVAPKCGLCSLRGRWPLPLHALASLPYVCHPKRSVRHVAAPCLPLLRVRSLAKAILKALETRAWALSAYLLLVVRKTWQNLADVPGFLATNPNSALGATTEDMEMR